MRQLLIFTLIVLLNTPYTQAADNSQLAIEQALGFNGSVINSTSNATAGSSVAAPPVSTVPTAVTATDTTFDYAVNINNDVFGAQLFTGSFAQQGSTQFNPNYMIEIGDQIQVRLWGGFSFDSILMVDPQGNIFLPQVGPLKVLGVRNQDLQGVVETAVRRLFRANVYCYASLAAAQPVRVFVGGFVNRPGLYNGTSMDGLLYYLDKAGGVDTQRGSFLDVQVKRGEQVRSVINLYDFLLKGHIPLVQLMDGDVIFVSSRQKTIKVTGLVANAKRFEFKSSTLALSQLAKLARPQAKATHVRIIRNKGVVKNIEYYSLAQAQTIQIANGDEVEFTADKKLGTITVRVEGEHQSRQEYVLPYGTHLGEVVRRIQFTEHADQQNIQLYRQSVRVQQKEMLDETLKSLENSVLTARNDSTGEAALRKAEADQILEWVERAKGIEPNGQVLIAKNTNRDELLLENGDVIKVPRRDGLVLVSGEVLFPNAIAYNAKFDAEDYVNRAGGYTQNASSARIVIAHRDGSFEEGEDTPLQEGDEVLVLPEVETKGRQILKEISDVIYKVAISARFVIGGWRSR